MRIFLTICLCLSVFFNMKAQNITNAEYFIDTDKGIGKNVPVVIPAGDRGIDIAAGFTADLSGLSKGIHFLYVRAQDENHLWSVCATKPFQVISGEEISDIVAAEYFIDIDPGIGQGIPINVNTAAVNQSLAFSLDLSGCSLGLHTLYTRVKSSANIWSIHNSQLFFITDAADIVNVTSLEYYFSGANGNTSVYVFDEFTPARVVEFKESDFLANTSALEYNGQYTLHVRALSSNGKYSDYSTVQFTFRDISTGNDEESIENMGVYPNPVTDIIHLKGLPQDQILNYCLYDMRGSLILSGELSGSTINTEGIQSGNYYLIIRQKSTIYGSKIIIK